MPKSEFLSELNQLEKLLDQFGGKKKTTKKTVKKPVKKTVKKPVKKTHKGGEYNEEMMGGGDLRHFQVVEVNGKKVEPFGNYSLKADSTSTPLNKAKTALSQISKKMKIKPGTKVTFVLRETTRGSPNKLFKYEGKRVKLAKPLEVKFGKTTVKINYKSEVKALDVTTPVNNKKGGFVL